MSVFRAHREASRAALLELFRSPEFMIPTLLLPVAFFVFLSFVVPGGAPARAVMLARFGVFATMGPALFSFGAGVAQERERGWLRLIRTSPAPASVHLVAKTTATSVMTAASLLVLYVAAIAVVGVELPISSWGKLALVHLLAAPPFVLLGLVAGFTLSPKAAIAAANLLLFAFAILGGLWFPVRFFPDALARLAHLMPTYHLSQLAQTAAGVANEPAPATHLIATLLFTAVTAGLAWVAWRQQR